MENIIEAKLKVVPYSENLKEEWNQFVTYESVNSTFLHSRNFYDHNPLNAKEDASLMFYKKKKIIAVFPAVLYLKDLELILHSHLRATYGGIVVSTDVTVEISIQIVKEIIHYAKQRNVRQIIVRNSFRIYHKTLCDEIDYAMWRYGFHIKYRELEISIPISGNYELNKAQYHSNTARLVKKSSKLLEISLSEDYNQFWCVLEKCLIERHGQLPVHDIDSITKLRENLGNDKVHLFAAHYQSKLIGGVVVFNFGDQVLHCQYIASDFEYNHLNPVHAIVDYLIYWGNKKGVKYLNLGMANEDSGKKINAGLFRFKESFGGRGILRETMFLNLK